MVRSKRPGTAAQVFIRMSRTARPMVELARLPGPNRLLRLFMPRAGTTGAVEDN